MWLELAEVGPIGGWQAALAPPYEIAGVGWTGDAPPRRPGAGAALGGDCEAIAVAGYHQFRAQGVAAYVLVGRLDSGEWHAVVWLEDDAAPGGAGGVYDPLGWLGADGAGLRPLFLVDERSGYRVTGVR